MARSSCAMRDAPNDRFPLGFSILSGPPLGKGEKTPRKAPANHGVGNPRGRPCGGLPNPQAPESRSGKSWGRCSYVQPWPRGAAGGARLGSRCVSQRESASIIYAGKGNQRGKKHILPHKLLWIPGSLSSSTIFSKFHAGYSQCGASTAFGVPWEGFTFNSLDNLTGVFLRLSSIYLSTFQLRELCLELFLLVCVFLVCFSSIILYCGQSVHLKFEKRFSEKRPRPLH